VKSPPDWLEGWARDVGTDLERGMAENPSWIAFALQDGVVYQRGEDFRAWRKDEYDRD
jgi:hypothetical protein